MSDLLMKNFKVTAITGDTIDLSTNGNLAIQFSGSNLYLEEWRMEL